MLCQKPEDRTFSWIRTECIVAQDLYNKVIEELEDDERDLGELIPTPIEYVGDIELYKRWWDNFKEEAQHQFKRKHADTIAELDAQKEANFHKLTLTDDQKLEYYVEQDREIARKRAAGEPVFIEPPQEYTTDLIALRGFFNCTLAVYMALLSTILDLLATEEFDFIELDLTHAERDTRLETVLVNTIAPLERKEAF